jgi:putative oxidoreductase
MKTLGYGVTALAVSIVPVEYPALLGFVIILADVFCALMLVLGGLMLVLGFWSRWVALAALPFVLGVVLKHLPNGWVFSNPHGGWSCPAFRTAALVVQMLLGDGVYSLRSVLRGETRGSSLRIHLVRSHPAACQKPHQRRPSPTFCCS